MANQSLNQIVREITANAEAHPMIRTVQFEPPIDWPDLGDIHYPAFGFTFLGSQKNGTLLTMNFTGWVLDMMFKEADNERDVWSDTQRIALDLIQYMDDVDREYQLVDGITIEAMSHQEPDLLSGVRFDFSIVQPMPSACLVPEMADGLIITEDNRPIYTEDGRAMRVE